MNNRIYFVAELQQMAESEVLSMIPNDTLQRIKQTDSHPLFKVFSIGHEGEATGANVIGRGAKAVRWARDVVVQMFNRIGDGLKAFIGHNPGSNSHVGREPIGEIVGKTMREIGGKLHTLGAVYIKPEHRNLKLDVASLEGVVEFGERMDGNVEVLNVKSITGLALDDGNRSTPAMPGATLQAALQMFTQENQRELQQMDITKEQVKEAILKNGWSPTEFYSEDQIISTEPAKKAKQNEYEHAKRLEKRLGEAREENSKLQGENVKLQDANNQLKTKANAGQVKDIFGGVAKEKKLDEKFVKFVEKNLKGFKSEKEGDEFKTELEKFVDEQAKDYKEMGELYGFDPVITTGQKTGDDDDKTGDKGTKNKGTPAADDNKGSKGDKPVGDKYTTPETNDFIPDE